MAAKTGTYTLINSAALSGTSAVTFSSIPATYTDLIVVVNGQIAAGLQNMNMQINSDTATNYSRTFLSGDGSTAASNRESSYTYITLDRYGYFSTSNTTYKIDIADYSNATTYKTLLSRSNGIDGVGAVVGLWRSTATITSLYLYLTGSTWTSGSTARLYGIEAAK